MDGFFWPVLLFPFFFVALWAGATLLLSFFGGWRSLAGTYRGQLSSVERAVSMGSGMMSRFGFPASMNGVLNVAVGAEGVQLSLFKPFALGSPPLLIPWSEMGNCRSYKALGLFDRFTFRPVQGDVKITLSGAAARMVSEQVAQGAVRRSLATA
jgi:hypothetical protein